MFQRSRSERRSSDHEFAVGDGLGDRGEFLGGFENPDAPSPPIALP